MQHIKTIWPYEIAHRAYDNVYVVYAFQPWPDDVLDNNPEALNKWLTGTKGWRAHGWVPVFVTKSSRKANRWVWKQLYGDTSVGENEDDLPAG